MIFSISILSLYFFIIASYTIGWFFLEKNFTESSVFNSISIVIAYRNEENNLKILLKNLINQEYPNEKFEIILINDNSTDKSQQICSQFAKKNRIIQLFNLKNSFGKKNAIQKGINNANGKLIITTDADCIHNKLWIKTINDYYNQTKAKMIIAPVAYINTPKLLSFTNLQALEFLSLIGTTAGSAAINKPIMCNAANLTFEKKIFSEFTDPLNEKSASGDDTFLMLNIRKKYPKAIKFLKNKKAIVKTYAEKNLKNFYNQRIRWASKTKNYKNFNILLVGVIILALNISLFSLTILSIFNPIFFQYFLILFIGKILIDYPILFLITHFTNNKKLLYLIPILQLLYFIYVTLIGLFSFVIKYKWKERKV